MTLAAWGGLAIAWIAAVASPGPDVLLILRLGVRERRAAVLAALGIMAGNVVWISASVLGMGSLLAAVPVILPAIQLAGSCVLVWLGVMSLRGGLAQLRELRAAVAPIAAMASAAIGSAGDASVAGHPEARGSGSGAVAPPSSPAPAAPVAKHPFWLGLTTNLANPKALVFFTALLSQFLPAHASFATHLAIIAAMVVSGVAWFVGVAFASSGAAFRAWFSKAAPWFDVIAGVLFLLIAAVIVFEALRTLVGLV